jgi:hypothetical protein
MRYHAERGNDKLLEQIGVKNSFFTPIATESMRSKTVFLHTVQQGIAG